MGSLVFQGMGRKGNMHIVTGKKVIRLAAWHGSPSGVSHVSLKS